MEIYKGVATFSGIAIGKILYYSRGEYQIRQCLVKESSGLLLIQRFIGFVQLSEFTGCLQLIKTRGKQDGNLQRCRYLFGNCHR